LTDPLPGGEGESIGAALCATHRSYHGVLADVIQQDLLMAMAHITGGGMQDNLPRVLPDDIGATVDVSTWPRPPLFDWLIQGADLAVDDAHQIFNCGIGMVLIVAPEHVAAVQSAIDEPTWVIGATVAYDGTTDRVTLINT
jgi:phosphoribosylaminoimidazole (AIR) synthetase